MKDIKAANDGAHMVSVNTQCNRYESAYINRNYIYLIKKKKETKLCRVCACVCVCAKKYFLSVQNQFSFFLKKMYFSLSVVLVRLFFIISSAVFVFALFFVCKCVCVVVGRSA